MKKLLCMVLALCCLVSAALADQWLEPTENDLPQEQAEELAKAEFQRRFALTDEQMGWFSYYASIWEGENYHLIDAPEQVPERIWDVFFTYEPQENTVYMDQAAEYLSVSVYMDSATGAFAEDEHSTDEIFASRLQAHLANLSDEQYLTSRDKAFQAARDQLQDDSGMTDAEMAALTAGVYLTQDGSGDGPLAEIDYSLAVWNVYFQNNYFGLFVSLEVPAATLEPTVTEDYQQALSAMVDAVQQEREQQEQEEQHIEAMNRWEAEKGDVIFWSYEDRAAFYAENGFAFNAYCELNYSWLLPEEDEIGYDAALALAREALAAHAGADDAALEGLSISASFGQMNDSEWGNTWSFEFWKMNADGTDYDVPYCAYVSASGEAYFVNANVEGSENSWYKDTDGEEFVYNDAEGNG